MNNIRSDDSLEVIKNKNSSIEEEKSTQKSNSKSTYRIHEKSKLKDQLLITQCILPCPPDFHYRVYYLYKECQKWLEVTIGNDCQSYKIVLPIILSVITKSPVEMIRIKIASQFDWSLILWKEENTKYKYEGNQIDEVEIWTDTENKDAVAEILKIVRKLKVTELVLNAVSMQDLEGITETDLKYIRFLRLENMKLKMKDLKKLVSDDLVRI